MLDLCCFSRIVVHVYGGVVCGLEFKFSLIGVANFPSMAWRQTTIQPCYLFPGFFCFDFSLCKVRSIV
uniref:Uncharacterized protein n=1 Tax=Physcomitrium patens TaxID=3218 RepID=A0A7I3ZSA0_PHYPA